MRNLKLFLAIGSWVLLMTAAFPDPCPAAGTLNGARSSGMSSASTAVPDDPAAMANNPAGLVHAEGTRVYGGFAATKTGTEYQSPTGETEKAKDRVYFPPHLYLSSQFGLEDWAFGLGLFSPFGIGGRVWPDDGLTRFVSIESTIATLNLNPTVAWRILPGLSLGAGLDYLWAYNISESKVDQSTVGGNDGSAQFEAYGAGWGFNLGLLYQPVEQVYIGLSFRSAVSVDQEGTAEFSDIAPALQPLTGGSKFETDFSTTLHFPEVLGIGVAWRPVERLLLAFDYDWANWSRFDETELDLEDEVPAAGITDITQPLDWDDAWAIKFGAEYQLTERLALRGGYAYFTTAVPDSTLSPANPDSEQHYFSIGAGYRLRRWTIDAFYTLGLFEDRTVENDILSGTYENQSHLAGLSVGYRF